MKVPGFIRAFALRFVHSSRSLNKRQTATFCSQLRSLLISGMPLLEALRILDGLPQNKKHRAQLSDVIGRINDGFSLSEAASGLLPSLAIGSLRAAERAGNLEETLARLAKYYEDKADLEEKFWGALAYPAFVLILSLLSVIALIIFVIPGMKTIFADLGIEPPLITSLILNLTDGLSKFWLIISIAAAVLGFFLFKTWKANPERVEKIILRLPLAGKIVRQGLMIQGLGTLGSLLESGTPINEALSITAKTSNSRIFGKIIKETQEQVINGGRLADGLEESHFFPAEAISMVKVGENSGKLAEMLIKVADFQAKEREHLLKRFTTLLEPAMTLTVGIVVGFVVLAMFLPLVNMISKLQ
ncbi:MAG: type II secretion system F family protein [Candidatus Margulisiibacteriota bacterium]